MTDIEPGPAVEFGLLPGQQLELSVSVDGIVRLRVNTRELPAAPQGGQERPQSELPAATTATGPDRAPTAEKQERVTIAGRVGMVPTFRTTPRGVRVARFTVAEHTDIESTTWRTILAFGRRADGLDQQPLERGQAVEVIGYPHQREVITNGVKKTVEEIYATASKRR